MSGRALTDADVQAVAERVVEIMQARHVPANIWIDTATVARTYAISEDWVREHAGELGALRIGDGPNGPLRFHIDRVDAAMERRRIPVAAPAVAHRRPGRVRGFRNSELETMLPHPDRAIV